METPKNKYAQISKYTLLKTLGTGYNSKVKLGQDRDTGICYAIKIIKLSHPKLNIKLIQQEIQILQKLRHPHIVNLIDYIESATYTKKNNQTYEAIAIVTEFVPGGEVFEYIAHTDFFSEEVVRTYFRIIIETLEYCHSQGVAHRDLKPENLLFDGEFNLKIADFGFATIFTDKESSNLSTYFGTELYMAPEMHMKKPYNGPSVDLFACGVMLFVMLSRTEPWKKADPKTDIYYKIFTDGKFDAFWKAHEKRRPKIEGKNNFYSEDFRNLLQSMLALDPALRLTIEQIKAHPWYNGPVISEADLKVEFTKRKAIVDAELQKQKEIKERVKEMMAQKKAAQPQKFSYTGIQPFRSLKEGEFEDSYIKEFEDKINFDAKRELREYQAITGFKACTEIFTVIDPDIIFKALCAICWKLKVQMDVSNDNYKIKSRVNIDEGACSFNIILTKVDETTSCVEFHKTSGNVVIFYKMIEEISKELLRLKPENE